jgi:phosphoglycerate dehydrogenase-like enzyme
MSAAHLIHLYDTLAFYSTYTLRTPESVTTPLHSMDTDMRLALQSEIPGLLEQLQSLAPNVEAFVLPSTDDPSERITADALLGTAAGGTHLPALIKNCEGLRWIHILGTGVDKFPLHLVEDKLVTCSRGATAGPIAEWVMAMLLAHEKQLPDRWVTEPPEAWYMAELGCLEKKTLGIIGFGAIGQAIAKRALAFDMNVIAKVRTHRTSTIPGVPRGMTYYIGQTTWYLHSPLHPRATVS